MHGIGARNIVKTIWDGDTVPSILHGAGSCICSTEDRDLRCEEIQILFWRTLLQVLNVMLRAQTMILKMKQKIWKKKILMVKTILNQERNQAKEKCVEPLKKVLP